MHKPSGILPSETESIAGPFKALHEESKVVLIMSSKQAQKDYQQFLHRVAQYYNTNGALPELMSPVYQQCTPYTCKMVDKEVAIDSG